MNAFCPPEEVNFNPIFDWCRYLIFNTEDPQLMIRREEKFGGDILFTTLPEMTAAYLSGALHPQDLKSAVADKLIEILAPARLHFEKPEVCDYLSDMEKLLITR
jgi:tyrosyl-tRNA synthetase